MTDPEAVAQVMEARDDGVLARSTAAHGTVRRRGTRMRAAVLRGPREFRLEEVPVPDPPPNGVRIRLEGCGICGSNLPVWEGRPWFHYPLPPGAPGHEGWGVVEAIGRDVRGVAEGQRVCGLSQHGFAELDIAGEHEVAVLPDSLGIFPGEPLGCAINVFRRATILPGDLVTIVGVGFLGALLCDLAANAGARVLAVSRRETGLQAARRCGAAAALPMGRSGDVEAIREWVAEATHGAGCPCVIEAAGVQETLDLAAELTAVRGRLVIAGYHQDGPRQVNLQQWNWRGIDVINAHERDPRVYVEGMRGAIEAVLSGRLRPAPLLTHRFTLPEIGRAFEALHSRPDGFLKGVLFYD